MLVEIPYGKGFVHLELPNEKTFVVRSSIPEGVDWDRARDIVVSALNNPLGSPRLDDIVLRLKTKTITLLITDKTRATPNRLLLDILLQKLTTLGIKSEDIVILVATGLHKPHTYDELAELVGEDIMKSYTVVSHNSDDMDAHRYLGKTRFGTEIYINKIVTQSGLVIALGLIEPHFFAGYSGGRKLILPGVAATKSVYQNHSFKMIAHPKADYGILDGNPVHEDMVEASKNVENYRFIVHVILDKRKRIVDVVAGDPYEAHRVGVDKYDSYAKVPTPYIGDIVVVSNGGYPLDRDLYQAVKGMTTGARVAKPGGVIVTMSECIDGVGHEHFRALASIHRDPNKILKYISENEPLRDQWQVQKLAQVLLKNRVVIVTKSIKHEVLEEMNLIPASTPEEGIEIACRYTNCERIIAIPEGPYIIPEYKGANI